MQRLLHLTIRSALLLSLLVSTRCWGSVRLGGKAEYGDSSAACKHSGICSNAPTVADCQTSSPHPHPGPDSRAIADSRDNILACTFDAESRAERVKEAGRWTWKGYRDCAAGWDEVAPLSCTGVPWFRLCLNAVDGLDTLYLMGLETEYNEAVKMVLEEVNPDIDNSVNLFETTIRIIGGLLSAYRLTNTTRPEEARHLLDLAIEVGSRLHPGFNSPSGIPYSDVNLKSGNSFNPSGDSSSSTSEISTLSLEFATLARYTGHASFEDNAMAVHTKLTAAVDQRDGLLPQFFNVETGAAVGDYIMMGARSDSYYEYLLKHWILTGKTDEMLRHRFVQAMQSVRKELLHWTGSNNTGLLYISEKQGTGVSPKMDHLVCFLPGLLALADFHGVDTRISPTDLTDLDIAEHLTQSCYEMYRRSPAGLAPEIVHFNERHDAADEVGGGDFTIKQGDAHNLLRPETVESIYLMWKVTGRPQYREWAWLIFRAFEKWTKLQGMDQCKAADPLAAAGEVVWAVAKNAASTAATSLLSGHNTKEALLAANSSVYNIDIGAAGDYLEHIQSDPDFHAAMLSFTRTAAIAAAAATVEALEGPSHPPVDNAANTATKMFGKGLHDVDPRELYRGCTEKSRGGGYTNLQSVLQVPPPRRDKTESFWLAETLKYLYLVFAEGPDRCLHPSCKAFKQPSVVPLDKFVFNTEAHPLAIIGPASASILARVEFNETLLSIHDHSLQPQEHNLEATVVVQNEDVVIHSDNVAEPAEPILAGVEFLEHPNDDQEKQGAVSLEASTEIDGEDHGEL